MNTLIMLEAAGGALSFSERAGEALEVSFLGMATIFAVLATIWAVLELFRLVFAPTPKKEKEAKKAEVIIPSVPTAPVANYSNDEEIIAAIMAAISVVTDKPVSSFRVVSFRKTGTR